VYADGPDGPLPDPEVVARAAGLDAAEVEVLLGWVVREPPWLATSALALSTFMVGPGTRAAAGAGRLRVVPSRLSALPGLLAGRLRPVVAVVGAHERPGGWRLARSPGWAAAAARSALGVVVERWPAPAPAWAAPLEGRVVGVIDRVDPPDPPPGDESAPAGGAGGSTTARAARLARLGGLVAGLIPDGATIQWGPGSVGAAVVSAIERPVRVRSGLVTTELVGLARRGLLAGRADAAYAWGGTELWEMVDHGQLVLRGIEEIHDLSAISSLARMVAINTALQVGLDGSVNVEVTAGGRVVAGPGGHPDFAAGASRSADGLSVVALESTAGGRSTIVARPEVVSTPRSDVDVVVTEHGVADLRDLDASERAARLIAVAAPEHREALEASMRSGQSTPRS
jgi:acyl-CoA hydrolase